MPSSLDLSLGAMEIGALISSVLLGITTAQVHVYWQRRFKDHKWIQLLVTGIWTLEACHTICVWIYIYRLTVTYYGVPSMLTQSYWTFDVSALFDGIIGALVQASFAYRILILSDQWYIPVASWLGTLVQLSGTVATMALGSLTTTVVFAQKYQWIVSVSLAANVFVDVVNTSALCWYLRKGRDSNKRLVETLMRWSIETGLLTVVASVLMLILSLAEKGTSLWIAISFFYAKLYSNCFLAALNGRDGLRRTRDSNAVTFRSRLPGKSHVPVIEDGNLVESTKADKIWNQVANHERSSSANKGDFEIQNERDSSENF